MILICGNATLFNDRDTDLYDLAQELRQKIKKATKPVLKAWRAAMTAAKKEIGTGGGADAASDDISRRSPSPRKCSLYSSESDESSDGIDERGAQRGST